ncbi:MAG: hypothetical protein HYY44_05140 [Deltaproteobacteria bacterium]|nr:hypothetical protein [Deltaproteobacteria bacterium]MBI4373994.1 hypothetical protein [Deltaproteobacteria bacterium]
MLNTLKVSLYLGSHLLWRLFKKGLGRKSPGLKDFLSFYKNDFIIPYRLEDKNPALERCLLCGLCDSLCPALKVDSGKKILGPSFFPMIARSVPAFLSSLPENFDEGCQGCQGCEAICPERVPIKKLILFMKSKQKPIPDGLTR